MGENSEETRFVPERLLTSSQRAERLQIRKEYRKLISDVQSNKEELVKPHNEELLDHVKKANSLFSRVISRPEVSLDARFMVLSMSLANEKANLLPTDLAPFDPDEFMDKLITKMNGRHIGQDDDEVQISSETWRSMGGYMTKFFKSVTPALSVLSGVFEVDPQPPNPKGPKRSQNAIVCETQPQHFKTYQGEKNEATVHEIEAVLEQIKVLHKNNPLPIDYFELVINPVSFGQTIENIFHLSFLAKDGFIRIYLDEDKIPVVEPIQEKTGDQESHTKKDCNQFMVSLSMEDWKDLIDAYQLEGRVPYLLPRQSKPDENMTTV